MKHKTNTQFMNSVMEHSSRGALIQAFVLEGLSKYADLCIEAGADELKTPLISGEAWLECAREYKRKLEEHLHD